VRFIVLVGPKHAGKTTAGIELARRLGLPFTDLDALITERTGKSPRELYTEGPELFRRREAEALEAMLSPAENGGTARYGFTGTAAAGGGIIDNPAAMRLFKAHRARLIYLEVSAESAWERISGGGELPPFLRGGNPREQHRLLHERRARAYRKAAAAVIRAEGTPPLSIAEAIEDVLQNLQT
jgi:shikimate kinase